MTERIRRFMKESCKDVLMDLIYPRHCPLCDTVLRFQAGVVCERCLQSQKRIKPPYCMKCGKTVEDVEEEYCKDCMVVPKSFQQGFPVFVYKGAVKQALYDFKYKNQRSFGDFFATCIVEQYGDILNGLHIDGIVPVPLHKSKKHARGYNQAEILAKALEKRLMIPMYPSYIARTINTNPQKELNDKTRLKNLKNAFNIGENKIELKKVLLVDDIYTSGATIEACTQVLLNAGVQEIYYTSVAIGKGYSE